MCGIAGFMGAGGDAADLERRLDRMADTLIHRGPDEYGRTAVPGLGAGLACRRLSLVDLEAGRQPIANEDGSVLVVMNGEIYNHRELRAGLEQRGHRFRTGSDAEVAVHLYEEEGSAFLPRLDGMFGLAILDVRSGKLLLARDRCGMKPLYYATRGGETVFASEIKALWAAGLEAEPDEAGIDTFLSLGYVPAPNTCFAGVRKLAAGHAAAASGGEVATRPFWSFTFDHDHAPRSEAEYVEEFSELFDRSIRSHLAADVPVGVLLSGGWDSALAAEAAARIGGKLQTFSAIFPDAPAVDESRYQRALAGRIGSEHHEIEFRAADMPELLTESAYYQDVPSLAFPAEVQMRIAELASRTVKATLSGEGSDEIFAGYSWYAGMPYGKLRRFVPRGLARPPAARVVHPRWGRFFRVLAAPDEEAADAEVARIFTRGEKRKLLPDTPPPPGADLDPVRLDPATAASCRTPLERRLATGFTRTMPDGLLMTADRISMARSQEVRMPFLSNAVVDFARRLPPEMKRRGEQEKYILSLLKDRMPREVAERKKHFLQAPVRTYYRGPLRKWVRETVLEGAPTSPLNRAWIEKRFNSWLDGGDPYVRRVRAVTAFQLWWKTFFEDSPRTGRHGA